MNLFIFKDLNAGGMGISFAAISSPLIRVLTRKNNLLLSIP